MDNSWRSEMEIQSEVGCSADTVNKADFISSLTRMSNYSLYRHFLFLPNRPKWWQVWAGKIFIFLLQKFEMRIDVLLLYNFPYSVMWKFSMIHQMEKTFNPVTLKYPWRIRTTKCIDFDFKKLHYHLSSLFWEKQSFFWQLMASFFLAIVHFEKEQEAKDQSLLSHRAYQFIYKITETNIIAVMNN